MARHLITSALPYINGVKHLGNLVGSMLPADVHARYLRMQGHEVLAICATDEHGTPAELAAAEAGQTVQQYCDEQFEIQRDLGERFGLSWDWFGRTSRPQNHELTNHFARKLEEHGYLEERSIQQVYSPSEDRFLPDRYVTGTCPHCGFERARGDQCENCGRLLDPTDLIDPRSTVTGATDLEVRESKSVFLLQTKLADRVRGACRSNGPAWSTRSGTSGSTRRSVTSPPPRSGLTQTRPASVTGAAGGTTPTTSPTPSSWARTTSPSTPSASRSP